jgi:type III pantothenate kinase
LNICIDIGNTSAKLGVFVGDELQNVHQNVSDRGIVKLLEAHQPGNVLIGSVRKGIGKVVERSKKICNTIQFSHALPLPIKNAYATPQTLGVDRMASAVAAQFLYPESNKLVVDIGTCITYDFIDATGTYQGGGISPGVEMRLKSMHKYTSKLPIVSLIGSEPELIGKTTKDCMLSGAMLGTRAEIEGVIGRYQQFYDNLTIIFCGGGAIFFESKIKGHIFAIPNLVLIGLNQILRNNLHD